jgi:hypothetical protein
MRYHRLHSQRFIVRVVYLCLLTTFHYLLCRETPPPRLTARCSERIPRVTSAATNPQNPTGSGRATAPAVPELCVVRRRQPRNE